MRFYTILSMLILSMALGGCLGTNSDSGSDPVTTGLSYYYAEFSDVAIPNEMNPDKNDTFITYSGDGIKLGTQLFKGRVEIASLVSAMQGHMQRDGWSLRSVFRATKGAILIFEQQKKMCSMYIFEDLINTGMLVFVSPKLGDGVLHYTPSPAASSGGTPISGSGTPISGGGAPISGDPVIGSSSGGNVTVYPAR